LAEYTKRERYSNREFERIEKLVKLKNGVRTIAKELDRCPSNVSRHLNNPQNQDEYRVYGKWITRFSAAKAVENQNANKIGRGRMSKVSKDDELREYLEDAIKNKKWSPQIALGSAKKEGWKFTESISVKTVYNSIYRNDLNISLFDLHLKLQRKPNKERIIRIWKRLFGKRIDKRPDISDRKEFGHWEIDTVFWGRNFSILVIVERKTRLCKIIRLQEHTSKEVNEKLTNLNLPMKTLTADNGTEFASLVEVLEETYFTHPYSSWEKGSVENLNGLIRRYLPRNTPIEKITDEKLQEVEDQINNLPRPMFDYFTAKELYRRETLAA